METLTIGFSRSRKKLALISWLIRLYQRTPYSHTYLKFHSATLNRLLTYEAVGSGVRFIGNQQWSKEAEEIHSFTIPVKKCNYITILQYCVDHAGSDYGFMQNVGVILARIFRMKSNPFKKGKNCSELVAEVLIHEGYKFDKQLDLITPKDIYKVLKDHHPLQ